MTLEFWMYNFCVISVLWLCYLSVELMETSVSEVSSLRSRGHSYTLPHTEFSLYKNLFVNRCLFALI